MSIRRILTASAAACVVGLLLVLAVVAALETVDSRRAAAAADLGLAVRKLSLLRGLLPELAEQRVAQQWRQQAAEVSALLDAVPASTPDIRALHSRLQQENRAVVALFENLATGGPADSTALIRGQLDVRTASMVGDLLTLSRMVDQHVRQEKRWLLLAMLAAPVLLIAVILALLRLLHRQVATPITQLAHAAALVGAGELEQPIEAAGTQEVAALAGSLDRMRRALRERDKRRDDFLGMLSHELRNPLAPIRSSLLILDRVGTDSESGRRALTTLQRQTRHLTRLVDDLLDATRVARGKLTIRRERLDLRRVVRSAVDDHHSVIDGRGLRLSLTLAREPVMVDGDADRLAQMLSNLIHNAVKFTPQGGSIAVALGVTDGHCELRVEDTGSGIAAELMPQLFQPFVQAPQPLARSLGGLGLGLALVKGAADLQGGSVHAQSSGIAGEGSRFVVRLPLAEPAAQAAAAPAPAAAATLPAPRANGAKTKKVLVVDDDPDVADSLASLVALLGYGAEIANDGPAALRKIQCTQPALVLCDIGLPGMSGFDVARAVRAAGSGVRLVAVSGYARPQDREEALRAGFDDHIAKPAPLERIVGVLDSTFGTHSAPTSHGATLA